MKRLNALFYLMFAILSNITLIYSQPVINWTARYDGPAHSDFDRCTDMYVDGAGNVYVTGCSDSAGNNEDYTTIKYNTSGVMQWIAKYNGPDNFGDIAYAILVDGSGNVYVTGESRHTAGNLRDVATVKYNSSGVQQWAARYNGPTNNNDFAVTMAIDPSGNVYVAGQSVSSLVGDDYLIIKYSPSGTELWVKRYNGTSSGGDHVKAMCITPNGHALYVTGESPGSGTNFDYWTMRLSSSTGDTLWSRRYAPGGNRPDRANSIALDNLGNIIVTGASDSTSSRANDYTTIKYDTTGNQLWVKRFNGNGSIPSDMATKVRTDVLNNIYVTGQSVNPSGGSDMVTIKYSQGGDSTWVARYNNLSTMSNTGTDVRIDGSGNVYITGGSENPSTSGRYDYATIKYNSSGVEQFALRFNGPVNGNDESAAVGFDNLGNIYVTGKSDSALSDMLTLKYGPPNGIHTISNEVPNGFSLSQNYPNPFNPSSKFKVQISKLSKVKIIVFDIQGRGVQTLVDEQLRAGTYEVDFDGSNLASGVYYYTLIAGDFKETRKMVLIK